MKPFFDPTMLSTLANLGERSGSNIVGQIVDLYCKTSPQMLEELSDHIHKKKFPEAGKIAHKLKSSCANLGFLQLHEALSQIEEETLEGPRQEALEKNLSNIKKMYEKSLETLKSQNYMT